MEYISTLEALKVGRFLRQVQRLSREEDTTLKIRKIVDDSG